MFRSLAGPGAQCRGRVVTPKAACVVWPLGNAPEAGLTSGPGGNVATGGTLDWKKSGNSQEGYTSPTIHSPEEKRSVDVHWLMDDRRGRRVDKRAKMSAGATFRETEANEGSRQIARSVSINHLR